MTLPFWNWAPYAIVLLQALCIIHLLRTGRSREWLYLLIFLPVVGGLIYIVYEVLPALRNRGAGSPMRMRLFSGGGMKDLEKQLRLANTDKNRLQLAAAHAASGQFEQAMTLTRQCLTGIYAENPGMMQDMARYSFGAGKMQESIHWFEKVHAVSDRRIGKPEDELMYARALEQDGQTDRAIEAYRQLIRLHHALEVRYRYGMLLKSRGDLSGARSQFQAILDDREHHPPHVRRSAAAWIRGAKSELRRQ